MIPPMKLADVPSAEYDDDSYYSHIVDASSHGITSAKLQSWPLPLYATSRSLEKLRIL